MPITIERLNQLLESFVEHQDETIVNAEIDPSGYDYTSALADARDAVIAVKLAIGSLKAQDYTEREIRANGMDSAVECGVLIRLLHVPESVS